MELIARALWIFAIFSFLGWLVKFIWYSFRKKKIVNPGFITLPFIPAAGIGALAMYFVTYNMENTYMIFLGSAVTLTVGKYLASRLFERTLGFKWRDYSKRPLNLNGYVTFWEAITYGLIAVFLRTWGFDWLNMLIGTIPLWIALLIGTIATGIIIFDVIFSIITVIHLRRNLRQMSDISSLIEENDENNSNISNDELRSQYERKLVTSKRFRLRLVKAFPDMESLNYEKQLTDFKERFNLIREENKKVYENKIEKTEERPFAYGLSFTKLFWLFFVGSFFGTILETIWAFFAEGHFEMRVGLVWGPFIPVYGGGAVAITLSLYRLYKARDLIVYLASAIIGATFEYFCSYFQEMFLDTVSWDYSDTPFNIDGRTNLMFALIWGLLGLFWLRYIYPGFSRLVEKIPKKPGTIITIVMVVFMVVNSAVSCLAVYRHSARHNGEKANNVVMEWVDNTFNDDYMNFIYPHMLDRDKN